MGSPEGLYTKTLAKVYEQQGYYDKAAFVYEKILAADPSQEQIKQALEQVKLKGGQIQKNEIQNESDGLTAKNFLEKASGVHRSQSDSESDFNSDNLPENTEQKDFTALKAQTVSVKELQSVDPLTNKMHQWIELMFAYNRINRLKAIKNRYI